MRKILLSSAIVLSFVGGASAMAATKAAPAAKPVATATMSKSSNCAKQWKAETSHIQSRKAFMAACEKA